MQYGILVWVLDQKNHISGKSSEIRIKSLFSNIIVLMLISWV